MNIDGRYRGLQGQALLCARRLRHPHQPDDHRGSGARRLTEAFAIAMGQEIRYDDEGNVVTARSWTSSLPTAVETRIGRRLPPSRRRPHHRSAPRASVKARCGGVPAFSNAVNDASRSSAPPINPDAAQLLAQLETAKELERWRGAAGGFILETHAGACSSG